MARPDVSVVMPFGGPDEYISAALHALRLLDVRPGDELILADNSPTQFASRVVASQAQDPAEQHPPVILVSVPGERSPAHARNVGAAAASNDWVLFLDADCRPRDRLLEAYFADPVADDIGALAGQLAPVLSGDSLAARYGAARNFLDQTAHVSHPYRPRAAAANLLVRQRAFEQIGGFYEGLRAGEDTDFSWRLQQAGWRLELRLGAWAGHRYRETLGDLRRQWRAYAAGRGWLSRRYEGFHPEPAMVRGMRKVQGRIRSRPAASRRPPSEAPFRPRTPAERSSFKALDVLLALEELAGFLLSNRPTPAAPAPAVEVVLVTDRFPGRGDPLVELATAVGRARIEAVARPEVVDLAAARRLNVCYLEDEGVGARVAAGIALTARRPRLALQDLLRPARDEPSTWALAPVVHRLDLDPEARIHALGGERAQAIARRLARLAGRQLQE